VAVNGVTFDANDIHVNNPPPGHGIFVPTISFGPNYIDIAYPASQEGQHFSTGTFNGLVFSNDPATDPAFGDVHLITTGANATNIVGLTEADVTNTAHTIRINVQNLHQPTTTPGHIRLAVGFGPPFITVNNGPTPGWSNPTDISINGDGILPAWRPLLLQAEHAWEAVANIHFVDVTGSTTAASAEIQVSYAKLHAGTTGIYGDTHLQFIAGTNTPAIADVTVEDPTETKVTPIAGGDFQYDNTAGLPEITNPIVSKVLLHELGHALGLAHNPTDPNSIMAEPPLIHASIDASDIAAIQTLYGPAVPHPPSGSGF
jgi:hypothetical protein